MMKRLLYILMLLLATVPAAATDFIKDAIHYRTLTETTVTVTNYDSSASDGSTDVFIGFGAPAMRAPQGGSGYTVVIPDSVEFADNVYEVVAIGNNAFLNLYKLEAVSIPASIQTIGKAAFAGCSGLKSINCFAMVPPSAQTNTFASVDKSECLLRLFSQAITDYTQADVWKEFANVQKLDYTITYLVDDEEYATVDMTVGATITLLEYPTKTGYTFSGWSGYPEDLIMPDHDVVITGSFTANQYADTVNLNEAGFATFSSPIDMMVKTPGVEAYKATVNDSEIVLTKLDGYIPAGTGVVLYGEDMSQQEVALCEATGDAATNLEDNHLHATTTASEPLVEMPNDGYIFVLGKSNKFQPYSGASFAAQRAFIHLDYNPLANNAASLRIVFADEENMSTGIEALKSNENKNTYDLAGRPTKAKGMVVKEGRIVFIR